VNVVTNDLVDFLYIFQTKPSFWPLLARSPVLISVVSLRIYQLQKLKISETIFIENNLIIWENKFLKRR
jgi:hypothetical protein